MVDNLAVTATKGSEPMALEEALLQKIGRDTPAAQFAALSYLLVHFHLVGERGRSPLVFRPHMGSET